MVSSGERVLVEVSGRRLTLSNLDKVLYPDVGFTKGEVLDYYRRVAPVMLPHLAGRPVTFSRYPDGVDGQQFYQKDVSPHVPDWVRTARLSHKGEEVNHYPLVDDLPTLIWAANLAALELHVPQWKVGPRDTRRNPDLLVFDLDPGQPADVVDCCRVAERLCEVLTEDGLAPAPKTSGSKGLQIYCGIRTRSPDSAREYAKAVAERLAAESPGRIVARMTKSLRHGKVFIDWSQNNQAKTTVAPYSLRGRARPTVSTPVTMDEIRACRTAEDLVFTSDDVLDRLEEHGDLFAGLPTARGTLPRG
ncbi:non-homologous end-joining DNA ligase [Amycolatopsis nigrescens]|uniref:non-homologous end-joining DNA ligase n=1 Tax=Amycolatopsis nigrescens TaxID=381445 RepID=UPI000370B606|nr:non-homologous end-joining DNA ligase [Amycolatopsis nigrescens]